MPSDSPTLPPSRCADQFPEPSAQAGPGTRMLCRCVPDAPLPRWMQRASPSRPTSRPHASVQQMLTKWTSSATYSRTGARSSVYRTRRGFPRWRKRRRSHRLIQPRRSGPIPSPSSRHTHATTHGIYRKRVAGAPPFACGGSDIAPVVASGPFLVAHNARFKVAALHACRQCVGILARLLPVQCSTDLVREAWPIHPVTQRGTCPLLAISFTFHDPLSDAHARARVELASALASRPSMRGS